MFLFFSLLLFQVALGFYVFFRNVKDEINSSFSWFCFSLAIWTFSVFMLQSAGQQADVVFWGKYIYVGPILLVYFFLYFMFVFPRKTALQNPLSKYLLFIPTLLVLAMVPGSLILKSAQLTSTGPVPQYGAGYPLFAAYFLIYFIYGIFYIIRKYRSAKGSERTQMRYFFLGLFLSFFFAIITNLILPPLGLSRYFYLGPFFTLFLLCFTAYAIVKHRLMSIEIVIQRSTVYGVATILIMALYALAVIISEAFLRKIMGYTSLLITAGAALIIAVAYQPLIMGFQGLTDRIFFRKRYDYQKTIRKISQKIASVIKLEELSRLIVSSFIDTMKVSEISFLLLEKEKEHFRSVSLSIPRYKKIEIDVGSPIVSHLAAAKDILVHDEIEDEIDRSIAGERLQTLKEVRDEMERLGISVWVPIISKEELIGIIALGNKLSGDVFNAEDLGLLSTLANQTSIALDNARLYDEVVNMKDYSEEILQSMVSGVLTVDVKGRIITFNSMAEKITGRKAAVVVGKTCQEIWGDKGTITSIVDDILKKEKRYINFESGVISPERGMVPVSFSSTILYDHNRKKIGALLTISDLTDVRELEEKVRRADKLSALATMAAGMAHEIKNPLSSMKVLSQLLPLKFKEEEFRNKFIEIMPREISRIDRIVESLLGFARATAPKYEKMKIESVIEENVQYFADQAKNAGVKITAEYADLPEIMGDHDQLSQVFSNLILNAIQAMPDGGEIRINTREGRKIENILQNIQAEIADTGHGITPQNLKKLFDPFFTTKYSGTGLGLTITHSIVDGHRGTIDVKSEPGKGTAFIITLPVSQELI